MLVFFTFFLTDSWAESKVLLLNRPPSRSKWKPSLGRFDITLLPTDDERQSFESKHNECWGRERNFLKKKKMRKQNKISKLHVFRAFFPFPSAIFIIIVSVYSQSLVSRGWNMIRKVKYLHIFLVWNTNVYSCVKNFLTILSLLTCCSCWLIRTKSLEQALRANIIFRSCSSFAHRTRDTRPNPPTPRIAIVSRSDNFMPDKSISSKGPSEVFRSRSSRRSIPYLFSLWANFKAD